MLNDFRFALRQLRKAPAFTAVALLTLGLGIGVNTAIFSVIQSVLLRGLPYPGYERLVVGWERTIDSEKFPFSYPDVQDFAAMSRSYEHVAVSQRSGANLVGIGAPVRVQVAAVTAGYFGVAGVQPILGRAFTAEEDKAGAAPVAVLSEAFWRHNMNADPSAIGKTLNLNGTAHTIVGVMPSHLDLPQPVDLWRPLGLLTTLPGFTDRVNYTSLFVLAKLRPGVTLEQAQSEATTIWARIKADSPNSITTGITVRPLLDSRVGEYRRGLLLLFGAVVLVLLIACTNLSNLLLARGAQRSAELAVRAALGASRRQIVRQLLLESLLLSAAGGVLGILFAHAARALVIALSPADVSRFRDVGIDGTVVLFGIGVALLAGTVSALWPAWSVARIDLAKAMSSTGRSRSAGVGQSRAREGLIVAEVALTLVLLVSAGLLVKSFARVRAADLGFRPENLLLAQVSFPAGAYPDPNSRAAFADALVPRLERLPGVSAVAINTAPPLSPGWQTLFFVPGVEYPAGQGAPLADVATVSANYFQAAGIPLLRGRTFDATDLPGGPKSVIIDQRMARQYWPGQDVIGKRLSFAGGVGEATIVGLAPTLPIYGYASEPAVPQVYFLHRQVPYMNSLTLLLRTQSEPLRFAADVAAAVASIDPRQPIYNVRTMEQDIARTQGSARLYTYLLGCFSLLALALAAVGIYGVISYTTGLRTREIGIRMALGALRSQVFGGILSHGLRLIALGSVLGLLAAFALSRAAASLLYGVSHTDPGVYAATAALLAIVGLVACWWPARRAAKLDPVVALRME